MAERSERSAGAVFDWAGAHERLNLALRKGEEAVAPPPEQVREALRRRAADYAKPPSADIADFLDVVAFSCDGERYAVPLAESAAAAALANVMPVPGLPVFYLGLLSHRGAIYPIIDPRPLLGGQRDDSAAFGHAVLIRNASGSIGLAASVLSGVERFRTDQITAPAESVSRQRAIMGIGPRNTIIIDATRLLLDIRLSVDELPDIALHKAGDKT